MAQVEFWLLECRVSYGDGKLFGRVPDAEHQTFSSSLTKAMSACAIS